MECQGQQVHLGCLLSRAYLRHLDKMCCPKKTTVSTIVPGMKYNDCIHLFALVNSLSTL